MVVAVKASIIGAGQMGRACALGLARSAYFNPANINFTLRDSTVLPKSASISDFQYSATVDPGSQIVFLAVKPADLNGLAQYSTQIPADALLISMMAGVPIVKLRAIFPQVSGIVRFMTNLAIADGDGVACYYMDQAAASIDKDCLASICKAWGDCFEVGSEDLMDVATAIVGSFPAALYRFLEQTIRTGQELGFEPVMAEKLVRSIATSASNLAKSHSGDLSLAELIQSVCSKGGTTEAMLATLGSDFDKLISEAIKSATKKSTELGKFA